MNNLNPSFYINFGEADNYMFIYIYNN